jgi:hypothetical protein
MRTIPGKMPPYLATDPQTQNGDSTMSIVRVGLAETKNFSEGYEAIFGKKKEEKKPEAAVKEEAKKEEPKKEKK